MTSSNGNIFRVTGHLCGELTGHQWIPHTGQWRGALTFSLICAWMKVEQTIVRLVIRDTIDLVKLWNFFSKAMKSVYNGVVVMTKFRRRFRVCMKNTYLQIPYTVITALFRILGLMIHEWRYENHFNGWFGFHYKHEVSLSVTVCARFYKCEHLNTKYRGYPAKRALSAMRKHGG